MTEEAVRIIMDGLVLVLLAATIFFAARLSLYLKTFKDSRRDLDKTIHDLATQIEKAEKSVQGLRETAKDSGRDLQAKISEASALLDELQLVTQAGDSLATRLEGLAEKKSVKTPAPKATDRNDDNHGDALSFLKEATKKSVKEEKNVKSFDFKIRDLDVERYDDDDDYTNAQGLLPGEESDFPTSDSLHSRAEKELYEALLKNRKTEKGGV